MTAAWFAAGKHPCASDFFQIGAGFPLAVNLARWVEASYVSRTAEVSTIRSWRFWAAAEDMLCYGVLGDSRDSLGRPFPLLVAGQHRAKGWQRDWQEIPAAVGPNWAAMDRIAASDCPYLATFQTSICTEGAPLGLEPPSQGPIPESVMPPLPFEHHEERVFLSCRPGEKVPGAVAAQAHAELKRRVGKAPSSVFIGGLIETPRIIFFYRPLTTRDFSCLWRDETGAGDGAT